MVTLTQCGFLKCVNVKGSIDGEYQSTNTLQAQIMIDISCTPGWIKTIIHQICIILGFQNNLDEGSVSYDFIFCVYTLLLCRGCIARLGSSGDLSNNVG